MTRLKFILFAVLLGALVCVEARAAPTCFIAPASLAPTATITFTPPTVDVNGNALTGTLTYSLFMGTTSGGEKALAAGLTGSPINVTSGVAPAGTYYFFLEAVNSAGASAPSPEVCITFPPPPVGVPAAITVIAIA